MTVQRHYVIVANHDDATAYTYTNHGSALVEVKKWHNEFSGASDQDIYTDKPGRQSAPASQVPGVDSMNRKDAAELEDERFASDIADWLDGERKRGALGSIDIISGPGFLVNCETECHLNVRTLSIRSEKECFRCGRGNLTFLP